VILLSYINNLAVWPPCKLGMDDHKLSRGSHVIVR